MAISHNQFLLNCSPVAEKEEQKEEEVIITKTHGIVDDVIVEEDEEADEDEPKPKEEEKEEADSKSSSSAGQIECKYDVFYRLTSVPITIQLAKSASSSKVCTVSRTS